MTDRLYRSETDKILGGVCGGLAEHYDADPTIVRLLVIFIELITGGSALLLYLIAWLIIPSESEVKGKKKSDSQSSSSDEEPERNEIDYESPDSDESEEENSDDEKEDQK